MTDMFKGGLLFDPEDARQTIIEKSKDLCLDFIKKVEFGNTQSVGTYQQCKTLLEAIEYYEEELYK